MARRRRLAAIAAGLASAIAMLRVFEWLGARSFAHDIVQYLNDLTDDPSLSWLAHFLVGTVGWAIAQVPVVYSLALLPAVLLVCAGLLARGYAQSRVRLGLPDPIERLRGLLARPRVAGALAWLPAAAWTLFVASLQGRWFASSQWLWSGAFPHPWATVTSCALVTIAVALGLRALAARGLRALVQPLATQEETPTQAKSAGDITFRAVAVTRVTRGAVGAMGVGSLAMVAWVALASSPGLGDPRYLAVIAAYVASAGAAAFLFRRAARIVVGIDGVLVGRAFHAYRELDEARAAGPDLELVHAGRVVVRLQMHSDDAGRRDEVLARVRDAIAATKENGTRGAALVVQSRSSEQVAGAGSYREPTLTREQLWELVEGPTTDASTRTAAAGALVVKLGVSEHARLRVAADQCAEPRARVALGALLEEHEQDEAEALAHVPAR